jgi:hypothetical protein
MNLPSADTPLYNHPLPLIEFWLREQGCEQNSSDLHYWLVQRSHWKAEIELDIDQLVVRYITPGDSSQAIARAFKYSLSRQDLEEAVFAGP